MYLLKDILEILGYGGTKKIESQISVLYGNQRENMKIESSGGS
jgi:hypothetical protein